MIDVAGVGPGAWRGKCYNEETFRDFIPLDEVAPDDLFISASGHAMKCDELVQWLLIKRAWVNPVAAAPFTPEDIAAIRAWQHPELARLSELNEAAAACLVLAQNARRAGDETLARAHRARAATLAPDHAGLAAFDQWTPKSRFSRRPAISAPPAALLPPARRGWLGMFGSRPRAAAAAGPPAPAGGAQPASGNVPQATWEALRRLANALMQDTSPELLASSTALIAWQEHASALSSEVLLDIDAEVRIFGRPFSAQCRSVLDPGYRVNNRRCGATDLGFELDAALRARAHA